MPRYEYHCKECGYYFDVWASVAEKEKGLEPVCEKCGSGKMEQVFGGISIQTGKAVVSTSGNGGSCCGGGDCC